MKASKRDRISPEPKKKRGFFSRLIRGTVKLFVIVIGLSIVVGSFIDSPDRPKKTVVAAEKNQAPIPKAKPVMVASTKPAKKKKVVATISDNDIKCYAVFSLIRDVYFSTEWSSIPNGSLITESVYRTITDMQNNMDIAIGQSSEHKKARRKSYDYKKTLTATPNKTADAAIRCISLYKAASNNKAHEQFMAMPKLEQLNVMGNIIRSSGYSCFSAVSHKFKWFDEESIAYHVVTCSSDGKYMVSIKDDAQGSTSVLTCAMLSALKISC